MGVHRFRFPPGLVWLQRELSPSASTLRWNRMPARPPSRAPISAVRIAAAMAMRPTAVTSPSSTGMRGRFSCADTLYCEPATAASAAIRPPPDRGSPREFALEVGSHRRHASSGWGEPPRQCFVASSFFGCAQSGRCRRHHPLYRLRKRVPLARVLGAPSLNIHHLSLPGIDGPAPHSDR